MYLVISESISPCSPVFTKISSMSNSDCSCQHEIRIHKNYEELQIA